MLASLAGLLIASAPARAQVANFDAFSGVSGSIPGGYAGKNWNFFGLYDVNTGGNQASSGTEYAYVYCCPGSYPNPTITDVSNGPFDFFSAFVSSIRQVPDVFTVQGYNGTTLEYTDVVTVGGGPGHTEVFGFSNVTSVVFSNDNSANMTLDDVTFTSATPEPASMVLLATGLLGVFGMAHRRRKGVAA